MNKLKEIHPLLSLAITIVAIIVNSVFTVGELKTDIAVLNERIQQDLKSIDALSITYTSMRTDITEIKIRQAELDKRLAILESKEK